jgi:enoyl-CoA hydratase
MRADRASAHAQWDLPLAQALHQEWERGKTCLDDALQGAARFAAGAGRHGKA